MSAIFRMSGMNGESSKQIQLKVETDSINQNGVFSDQKLFIPISHDLEDITHQASPIKTEETNDKAKHLPMTGTDSKEALIEEAQRAEASALKHAADSVPHVRYPFCKPKHNKHKGRRSSSTRSRRRPLAHLKVYTKIFHCPSMAPRQAGDNRRLIKFYSKRYLTRPKPEFYVKNFLAGPVTKEPGREGPLIWLYERKFL